MKRQLKKLAQPYKRRHPFINKFADVLLTTKPNYMRLKSTLIAALCCALGSVSAFAHRDYFYDYSFGTELADGWTLEHATGAPEEGMGYIVTCDGSGDITYTLNFEKPVALSNVEGAELTIAYEGTDATAKIVLAGEDGASATLTADKLLVSNAEFTDNLAITKLESGKIPASLKKLQIVLAGSKSAESMCLVSKITLKSAWNYPTMKAVGEVRIEAEDFDEGPRGEAYGSILKTTNSAYRKDAPYLQFEKGVDKNSQYSNGFIIANNGAEWSKYLLNGEGGYEKKPVTVANATEAFGQWYNYTIKAEADCEVDITVGAGVHFIPYKTISENGCGDLAFEDLGGAKINWVKKYTGSWVLSLDGKNLRGTQEKRFFYPGQGDIATYQQGDKDPSKWLDTRVEIDGNKLNNDTVWTWPSGENIAKTYLTWCPTYQTKPHYQGIKLTKGTHVLKLQTLAPQFGLDYITVDVKKIDSSSVSEIAATETKSLKVFPNPAADKVSFGESVVYTVFDLRSGKQVLQGEGASADVSGLAAGAYVVRTADGRVAKLIKL